MWPWKPAVKCSLAPATTMPAASGVDRREIAAAKLVSSISSTSVRLIAAISPTTPGRWRSTASRLTTNWRPGSVSAGHSPWSSSGPAPGSAAGNSMRRWKPGWPGRRWPVPRWCVQSRPRRAAPRLNPTRFPLPRRHRYSGTRLDRAGSLGDRARNRPRLGPSDRVRSQRPRRDHRRRGDGVGSALIDAVRELCLERGMRRIFLETEAHNDAARRLYARHGFTAEGSIWMAALL